MRRLVAFGVLIVLVLFGVALRTDVLLSDIRPGTLGPSGSGAETMSAIHEAHGGLDHWMAIERVSVELEGTWDSPLPRYRMAPFLPDNPRVRLTFRPSDHPDAILESLTDGRRFEIRGGRALEIVDGKAVDGPRSLRLFTDALRHLVELPFAMQSATVQHSVNEAIWRGNDYERVFATWVTARPQPEIDQYILWRNLETGYLERFDATGRFIAPFAKASVELVDHRQRSGFFFPDSITVNRGAEPGAKLMSWRIVDVSVEERP